MRFSGAWLRYGRRAPWVLEDVTLALPAGRVAVIVGRNGAGKTTLLSAAAGLLRLDRGSMVDRPRSVGWVPERFPANQPFTARAYLNRMGRVRGLTRAAASEAVAHWADRLHLGQHLDTRLAELSKGTAQKVGLAQALLRRPDLLVLDEPWEGLDGPTRAAIPAIVAEVTAAGGRVLVSDHLGEVDELPGAAHWRVADRRVTAVTPPEGTTRAVIELGVAVAAIDATVSLLRAQGHDVIRVRQESADAV